MYRWRFKLSIYRSAIILNNVQFSIKSLSDDKTYAQCITYGWMTSKFYVLFNSFSVTSRECAGGKERLCAMQPCLRLRDVPLRRGSNPGLLDQWTKATGVPLQNKPCEDGWVEAGEESPHAP